jgi:2-C-methyl-D-erythritol 4-phosphate cytidylyltransferase
VTERRSAHVRAGLAVPAAGSGARMGGVKKPFLELAGVPVLQRALQPFLEDTRLVAIVVALGPEDAARPPDWLEGLDGRIRVVAGGATRTDSVRNAIAALPDDLDIIAVHDAARPFVTGDAVRRCFDVAASGSGAVAGTPAVDTIKRVDRQGRVVETPPRDTLWHAQTPQVFPAETLRKAYQGPAGTGTDDAALVEATGLPIHMVDVGPRNFKITHPDDLALGEAVLASLAPATP